MKDSRLQQVLAELDDARVTLSEIQWERPSNPGDVVALARAVKFVNAAMVAVRAAQSPCGATNTVGSVCVLPEVHDGPHRAGHGFEWTDESNRLAAKFIAKQIGGRD